VNRQVGVPAPRLDEEVLVFASGGHRLPGVLTRPAAAGGGAPPPGDLGVLLLSPGLKHRVGPHRLYVKLARFFAARGLPVFRFDFHGTGDAGGELPTADVPELHERIQRGLFRGDSAAALDVFCERAGVERVIACGLCGGAITGAFLAADDPRVEAVVGFQLPVKKIDLNRDFAERIDDGFSDHIFRRYVAKLLRPESWRKFLSGRSEYGLIWKTAARRLAGLAGRRRGPALDADGVPEGMNSTFLEAWDRIAGRVRLLWIYSEIEGARFDFEGVFETVCLAGRDRPYEKLVLPDSNHEFAPDPAQESLLAVLDGWLARHYGAGSVSGAGGDNGAGSDRGSADGSGAGNGAGPAEREAV